MFHLFTFKHNGNGVDGREVCDTQAIHERAVERGRFIMTANEDSLATARGKQTTGIAQSPF